MKDFLEAQAEIKRLKAHLKKTKADLQQKLKDTNLTLHEMT